jgi:DNA-directed RNA polymerase specialized sigma24 family protein
MVSEGNDDRAREFVRLLAACERRLDNYVLALVPNWSDAEEIVQQAKLRLWERFEQYDRSKDFGAWACTIAYYEVLTFRTRAHRSRLLLSQAAGIAAFCWVTRPTPAIAWAGKGLQWMPTRKRPSETTRL